MSCVLLAMSGPAHAAARTKVDPFGLSNTYPGYAPDFALQAQVVSKARSCERRRRAVFFFKSDKLGTERTDSKGNVVFSLRSARFPRKGRYSVEIRRRSGCRPAAASGRFDGEHFFVD